jgi:hypothetical protein
VIGVLVRQHVSGAIHGILNRERMNLVFRQQISQFERTGSRLGRGFAYDLNNVSKT